MGTSTVCLVHVVVVTPNQVLALQLVPVTTGLTAQVPLAAPPNPEQGTGIFSPNFSVQVQVSPVQADVKYSPAGVAPSAIPTANEACGTGVGDAVKGSLIL